MRSTEYGVDGFGINLFRNQLKELTFHDIQSFETFFEKNLMKL
tara:strand:+ start:53839 stop:53967 length:129 start_codon:yes stop_codon:yes gene_type:complete